MFAVSIKENSNDLIVQAPVLIPDTPDCDYHNGEKPLSKEKIREIATSFKNYGIIDRNHSYLLNMDFKQVGIPLRSWITSEPVSLKGLDGEVREYPTGTWMLESLVKDTVTKNEVNAGVLTGYSVSAIPRKDAENLKKIDGSFKARTNICDIKDPVAYTVSLVRNPCQHKAKFCSCKLTNKENENMSENNENNTNVSIKSEDIENGFFAALKRAFKSETEPEPTPSIDTSNFVTKSDLDDMKSEITESIVSALKEGNNNKKEEEEEKEEEGSSEEGLTPEEEKQLNDLLKKKEKATKSEPETDVSEGKGLHYHIENENISVKSGSQTVMEMLNRTPDGRYKGAQNTGGRQI